MIKRIKVRSGYASELKCLKDRTFEFSPRVNVLYGPNGCGKSTLLSIMGGYTGIPTEERYDCNNGWSGPPPLNDWEVGDGKFPRLFSKNTIGHCEALVSWDGMPAFLNSGHLSDATLPHFTWHGGETPDEAREELLMICHPNEGHKRMESIKKVIEQLKNHVPDLHLKMVGTQHELSEAHYVEYIKKLTDDGKRRTKPTLLWDGPDCNLGVYWQFFLFGTILRQLSQDFQIIVATHSPIPILFPNYDWVTIIDMQEGYLDECRHIFKFLENTRENFEQKLQAETNQV